MAIAIATNINKTKNMKTTKLNAIVSAGTCILVLAGSTQAGSDVPFKARFHGFAEPPVPTDEQNVFEIVVPLHGVGTHLGQFDERLVHHLNFNTGAFTGYADWTAANGDTFKTVFSGQLYPTDDPDVVSFQVTHTIVEGTGRFSNATGSFKGVDGLFNTVTGEDQGGYLGTISYH
jgi:hypothetical protein